MGFLFASPTLPTDISATDDSPAQRVALVARWMDFAELPPVVPKVEVPQSTLLYMLLDGLLNEFGRCGGSFRLLFGISR